MMDMFIQHSQDTGRANAQTKYVSNPNLLGQTQPISILPLKEHSTLIYIYQDPATNETAFHPVQADQQCHR